jgi:hypothetical protein
MALVDREAFGDQPTVRIYITGRLREARRAEQALTDHGVDYTLEPERFVERILGLVPREYDGLAFHVRATEADAGRRLLGEAGLSAGVVEDE